ncbi:hypothetical protein X275_08235 [Marinitoga sp. 1197]|uniref:hypothetical protein n=1 Tax=Marinitoga sp. 1197 TaxID=1428449 RepID=UPI00064154EC|nr:hypothetical protein [Marinitoga sp. 1197]KLO21870.1 hypothetical protein X275_08235 [Marinitoga sp. 1197]
MKEVIKKIVIDTSKQLIDKEYREKGTGIVVLQTPKEATIKFDSTLSQEIPLQDIESINLVSFDKFYISCPADIAPLEILVLKENIYVDANTNYRIINDNIKFLPMFFAGGIQGGNNFDFEELNGTTSKTFQKNGIMPSITGFQVFGDITNWQIFVTLEPLPVVYGGTLTIKEYPKEIASSTFVRLVARAITFQPLANASPINVYIEYFETQ